MNLRVYRVSVRDFDFEHVHVRARSHARAKYLCAMSYHEAGWGSVGDGLKTISGCRLDTEADVVPINHRRPEGLCRRRESGDPTDTEVTST